MTKHIYLIVIILCFGLQLQSQTLLEVAVDFHVKTIDGETIELFKKLDEGKIVVIDFFSTSCGPCQTYAPDFQASYEYFGSNSGNTFFVGINYNDDNQSVIFFDSIFGLTYPSVSGTQGGGNLVFESFQVQSWPTVVVIMPDRSIVEQQVWPPSEVNIVAAVEMAGGNPVGVVHNQQNSSNQFIMFPNPGSGEVSIQAVGQTVFTEIQISDISGKVILFRSDIEFFQSEALVFRVQMQKAGMYIVSVMDQEGKRINQKLMVH